MKILFFIDGLVAGGKERRLIELMKGLKKVPDIDFELVIMNEDIHYKEVFDMGVKIHSIIRKTKKDLPAFRIFYRICKDYKPDIVHCWDSMTAIYSIPACIFLNIKLVNGMVVDSPEKQNLSNKHWLRARLAFPFSNVIVGNSKSGLKAYRASSRKGVVIYNGFNFDRLKHVRSKEIMRKQLKVHPEATIIGMVGAFTELKDYKTFYAAAQLLLSRISNLVFLCIGKGTESKESRDLIDKENREHFRLLGRKSDVESYINAMDIAVLSTYTEGISNFILESMAIEKPVVSTAGGGTNEILLDNETGFLVEPVNPEQMAEKLEILIKDPDLCMKMGKAGLERVKNGFAIDQMMDRFVILYKMILEKK